MQDQPGRLIATDGDVLLRFLTPDDAPELALYANNINIFRNLRDGFPHPYTYADAEAFIRVAARKEIPGELAIVWKGDYAGNIGVSPGSDVYRMSAEIGYFVGESFWNKGICTRAVNLMTEWIFKNTDIVRLYAGVFDYNVASQKVLEKCGYKREAVLEMAIFKNGKFCNEIRYARINHDKIKEMQTG
jgi:[ribosomal protein S5]-alanine N-acetyltransferase